MKFCYPSNRTTPTEECHHDSTSIIKNGEILSNPPEDVLIATTQCDDQLPNDACNVFVKPKQSLQESA